MILFLFLLKFLQNFNYQSKVIPAVKIINTNNELEIVNVNIVSEQGNFIVIDNIENGKRVVVEPLINAKEGSLVNPLEN